MDHRSTGPASSLRAAAAAACMALVPAVQADAGPGAAQGNALNPAPINPPAAGRWMDEEGMGTRAPSARSPTGRLFEIPYDGGPLPEAPKDEWRILGFAELGGLHASGDDRAAGFLQYKDARNGLYLNSFAFAAEKPSDARFLEVVGGAAGRDDQFHRIQFGRYNDWKVSAYYDGVPHTFTSAYRSLWNGVGTGNLTLAGLAPGGAPNAAAAQAAIQGALAATGASDLQVVRNKAGVRLDMRLSDTWRAYASFSDEERKGARPFGAVFGGGGGGGNMEVAETIDYATHDFAAGVQFSDALSSFNVRAAASFFRNNVDTMTFQNPLYVTLNGTTGLAAAAFTQGRFDLPPDNQHYNVKGEYARALPDFHRGNFTASIALGTMRQDDALVAPTQYDLAGGSVAAGGAPLAGLWNTPAALGRQSAQARIDTLLVDAGLVLKPASGFDLRGKMRYNETRNSMQYQACNPLTGQWGRLLNDGSGLSLAGASTIAGVNPAGTSANAYNAAACDLAAVRALGLAPAAGNVPIASVPFDYRQLVANVAAGYQLGRGRHVEAALERESFQRAFRERDETHEDKVKLTYVDRKTIEGSIRVSLEHARRGGGAYDPNPYLPFLSASLGPTPLVDTVALQSWFHSIGQFRSYDLADRKQNVLNGRFDYALRQDLDAAMTLQLKDASYPAEYGRTGRQKSASLTLDMSYQAGASAVFYGYYANQAARLGQRGVQPLSCILGSTYYFYSDGRVLNAAIGAAAPATPAGTTLTATRSVAAGNWYEACGSASPTSPLFPEARAWDVDSRDRNHAIGFGGRFDLGRARLEASFSRTLARTRIGYSYNAAALGLSAAQVDLAGAGPSDLRFAQNILDASVLIPVNRDLTLRLLVRRESGRVRDWHYEGVIANPMPANNAAYLDGGAQDYRATLVGVFFQMRM